MKVLGFTDKSSEPANYKLPENMKKMRKTRKLNRLHEISAKVVDEFVFNSGAEVNGLIDRVLMEQEKDILQQRELTPDGRFPCRFPSCTRSFKYNGKARRSHELSHDPPVEIDSDLTQQVTTSTPMTTSQDTKPDDDVFNYNCCLLTDCFQFFNFLDAIEEGGGVRVMRQYKYFMLYCKADGSSSTKYALECLYQFFQIYAFNCPQEIASDLFGTVSRTTLVKEAATYHWMRTMNTVTTSLSRVLNIWDQMSQRKLFSDCHIQRIPCQ